MEVITEIRDDGEILKYVPVTSRKSVELNNEMYFFGESPRYWGGGMVIVNPSICAYCRRIQCGCGAEEYEKYYKGDANLQPPKRPKQNRVERLFEEYYLAIFLTTLIVGAILFTVLILYNAGRGY